MENLAEQERLSGDEIPVSHEVRGVINASSCRMDPLFTRSENSLEAARTLKSLRMICKCRSGSGVWDSFWVWQWVGEWREELHREEPHTSTRPTSYIKVQRYQRTHRQNIRGTRRPSPRRLHQHIRPGRNLRLLLHHGRQTTRKTQLDHAERSGEGAHEF